MKIETKIKIKRKEVNLEKTGPKDNKSDRAGETLTRRF
jgi:hypothetical protein